MPYIAQDAEIRAGTGNGPMVGTGECASLVQHWANAPNVHDWIEGPKVKDDPTLTRGTVIATFVHGRYPDNDGHAAIYLSQDQYGIRVIDQWNGHHGHPQQPPHERVIRFDDHNTLVNNGNAFSVVK